MDIERFKTIVERIKANPSCWNQYLYHCGSAHCIAGHAQIDSGKNADNTTAYQDAMGWLDLTAVEADWLFACHRTIDDFEAVIAQGGFYDVDGYGRDGFNHYGVDREGFNRFGYNRDGFNRWGFDIDGYDIHGFDRNGYDRNGYDREGFDIEGFDRDGYHRNNKPRQSTHSY